MIKRIAIVQINPKTSLTLKTEKQEMSYHCGIVFGFHIVQTATMLLNQAMLSDWAIGPNW